MMQESKETETSVPETDPKTAKKQQKKALKRQKRFERNMKKRKLLFPANKKGKHVMHSMNFLRFLFYPIHFLVYPYRLHGHRKVKNGACIYLGNHYCLWDVFYSARTTGEGIHYMMKESIFSAPVLGNWASRVGGIPAMRDGSDVRTIMDSIKVLKNGEKIALFPEGTRNKNSDEEFLPFHGGAALLAVKTQTPIVPFVICNRPRVFHVTHVMFGEPVELSEYYGKRMTSEDYAAADEKLKEMLYALREEYRASVKKKGRKK